MKRGVLARVVLAAAGVTVASAIASCRSPTEIEVVVTTDFDCADLKDVTVTVGTLGDALEVAPPTSTSSHCSGGTVGTIVVVPSGSDRANIGIKVVGGFGVKQAEDCTPSPGSSPPDYGVGCIVARRALDFTPHTPLTVPVILRASCNGIACGETQTCVESVCTSATIPGTATCTGDGCAEPVLLDGGAPEAGVADPACGDDRGLQPGAAWPVTGYCPSGQGRSPYLGPQTTPSLKWSVGAGFGGRPAIAADGTVYGTVYGTSNDLVAVDTSGTIQWTVPGAGQSDLAIGADGTVYAENTTSVLAFAPDGTKRWQAPIDAANGGALVIGGDGTIYAGGSTAVVALDPAGTQKWSAPAPGGQNVPVVIGPDGALYAGTGTGEVLSLATATGTQAWSYTAPDTIGGLVVGADGTVYAASWGCTLTALTPAGALAWSFQVAQSASPSTGYVGAPSLGSDGTVYFGCAAKLAALDPQGKLLWSFTADEAGMAGAQTTAPAVAGDGTIYFGAQNAGGGQSMYALDAAGNKVWSGGSSTWGSGEVAIGFDRTLVVAGGPLFAIGP